jgi:hypothetical protein
MHRDEENCIADSGGKRPLERSRGGWAGSIKMDLNETR